MKEPRGLARQIGICEGCRFEVAPGIVPTAAPSGSSTRARLGLHKSTDGSEGFEEFLVHVIGTVLDRIGDAVLEVVIEEPERDSFKRCGDGADLGKDVDAVGVFFDHSVDSACLSLDSFHPS